MIWLVSVLAVQFFSYAGLGLLIVAVVLSTPGVCRPWFGYLRRARWLLSVLWVVLAYNTAGEAFNDFSWAPTYEGITEANLHAVRLLAILGCLAWLFCRLENEALLSGMWGILRPLRWIGLDTERVLVRLSLVLEHLKSPHKSTEWQQMLIAPPAFIEGSKTMRITQPVWQLCDTLALVGAAAVLGGGFLL